MGEKNKTPDRIIPYFTQTQHHEEEEMKQLKSLVFHTLVTFSIYRHQLHHAAIVHAHIRCRRRRILAKHYFIRHLKQAIVHQG